MEGLEVSQQVTLTYNEESIKTMAIRHVIDSRGVRPKERNVRVDVNSGSPYYSPHDPGTSPTVKVIITLDGDEETIKG